MKLIMRILNALLILFILVGCSKTPETNEVTKMPELMSIGGDAISRSESTVKKDSASGMILTAQQSYQIGTQISIGIYDEKQVPDEVFTKLFELIDANEYKISKNIGTTEISKINANAGNEATEVSDETYQLLKTAVNYAEKTDGLFDVTIGAVVNLWDIGGEMPKIPEKEALTKALDTVGFKKVHFNDQDKSVALSMQGTVIDLGGIAKGYISDLVGQEIKKLGFDAAIINFGGNVYGLGVKPGDAPWVVGVRNPLSDGIVGTLKVKNTSVISSGVYERFFIDDNIRYHHILNPQTGYPEQNGILSVTIVTEKGIDGDALSTSLFLMGLEKGLAFAEASENIEALFIMEDQSIYTTSGLFDVFTLDNVEFDWKR